MSDKAGNTTRASGTITLDRVGPRLLATAFADGATTKSATARLSVTADGADWRESGEICEITGLVDLSGWPDGTRMIARREQPHDGAQLTFTDVGGYRYQLCVTDLADDDVLGVAEKAAGQPPPELVRGLGLAAAERAVDPQEHVTDLTDAAPTGRA